MDKFWGCLLCLIWSSWSCDFQGPLVEVDFPADCWTLSDSLNIYPSDWGEEDFQKAALFVDLSDDFPYRNIILHMDWELPSGVSGDTLLRAYVVDSLGYWIPPAISTNKYRHTFPGWEEMFPQRPSTVRITQFMRDSSLCGIYQAGILLGSNGS